MESYPHAQPINAAEEPELIRLAQAGDEKAAERVALGMLRYSYRWLNKLAQTFPEIEIDDLVQVVTLASLKALQKFDLARGVRFWTYASLKIRQDVQRFIERRYTMQIPAPVLSLDMPLTRQLRRVLSLDQPMEPVGGEDEPDGATLGDMVAAKIEPADQIAVQRAQISQMDEALERLPLRQRASLILLYGLRGCGSIGLGGIANLLGVSRQRAQQIVTDAQKRLRELMNVEAP